MDMTYVRIAQRNYVASRYMKQRAEEKAKQSRNIKIGAMLTLAVMILSTTVAFNVKADVQQRTDQEYIVRYGRAWNWGQQVQMDDDRKIITVNDPPEFAEGTDVRVVFATNGTLTTEDDTVVDVTER